MATIQEPCSVCAKTFDVTFRYQMEERDGGFAFFCSQKCLTESQKQTREDRAQCAACAKHFTVSLVSQVFYVGGQRRYACSMACRAQVIREASGVPLGALTQSPASGSVVPAPAPKTRPAAAAPASPVVAAVPISSSGRASPDGLAASKSAAARAAAGRQGPRRIAVFNHKGGTGKTTTSVSLAAGLADRGHRVLLLDTDSQGNVAVSLGARAERSLYHVLVMGLRATDVVQPLRPGLDLLPSNETLAAAELYLAGRKNRDRVLSQRLGDAIDGYDYVIIDCSPSLSLMNQNALTLADSVLVPVACDYLSLVGVRQVIKTVKNVNKLLRHPLRVWGVLPTFYDARAKICAEALNTLQSHFGDRCLRPIRATTKLKEAPAQARSIFEHAPGTHGSEDYARLVEAVLADATTSEIRATG